MSFQTIRHAQAAIWPRVSASLKLHRAHRENLPANPTAAALARAKKPWDRVVAEEAVWALAKEDLLLTEEARAVIRAARVWAAVDVSRVDDATLDRIDDVLYDAVQALATAPSEIPAEEALTAIAPGSSVPNNNRTN